jgi:hypothetical protein
MQPTPVYLAVADGWVWWRGSWRRWVDSWPCSNAAECLSCLGSALESTVDAVHAAVPNANEAVLHLTIRVYVSPIENVWIRAHPDQPGWQCALVPGAQQGGNE